MSYIYKITNLINNKCYIGKTNSSIEARWKDHQRNVKLNRTKNRPLYKAIAKYGIDNFKIEQIEECDFQEVADREIYWISYYDSYKKGYNATLGGDGKSFYDYNLIISTYLQVKNVAETARIIGCCTDTVSKVLHANGFTYSEIKNNFVKNIYKGAEVGSCKKPIAIAMLDKDTGKILHTFRSMREAERFLQKKSGSTHISEVCRGKRKTAYGYKWKFI